MSELGKLCMLCYQSIVKHTNIELIRCKEVIKKDLGGR